MAERLHFTVEGMDCASCARKIETGVRRIAGISDISINTMTETLTLSAVPAGVAEKVESVVRELGYTPRRLKRPDAVPPAAEDGIGAKPAIVDHHHHHHHHGGEDHVDEDHGAAIDG